MIGKAAMRCVFGYIMIRARFERPKRCGVKGAVDTQPLRLRLSTLVGTCLASS
jgi:hypothetical protein